MSQHESNSPDARAAAAQSRALLASIVESAHDAIVSKTLDGTVTSWNRAATELFGYPPGEMIGQSVMRIIPEERRHEEAELIARISKGERVDHYQTVRQRKDGSRVPVSISLSPIVDEQGKVVGAAKTARDLSSQQRAADTLKRTEEQLRQAQKMEAVGRLAGGVAHDFNNILTVILSYAAMLLRDGRRDDPMMTEIAEIQKAALRASELTRQLLTFSRQQIISPRVIDVNHLISGMDKMLTRILGEDIELAAALAPGPQRVLADPSSIEQLVMNLVVNARDAMPTGGKLTLETAAVVLDETYAEAHLGSTPGPHVMLAVTDSGAGMDAATQVRIFEPFFTTKGPGKGTGLGLSTVFGIVQQCGGSIWVYSEVDKGTTFKIYLPRVDAEESSLSAPVESAPTRGTERVLLVEDQQPVRLVAAAILKRAGFEVVQAATPEEAIALGAAQPGKFDLLLTDVVMPQMSGPQLAQRLAATQPQMKVLCMSGYTDDSVVRHGVLENSMPYLQKPFTPDSLTRKVRETLSAPKP